MDPLDAYIAKSAPFARPILEHIRALVHKACPHAAEAMKWGMPFFMTHGDNLCNFAAFKQHCAFGFWKGSLLEDKHGIIETGEKNAMGSLGKITALEDLPPDKILIAYLKEADKLNKEGIKVAKAPAAAKKELAVPPELTAALKKNKAAQKVWDGWSYSHKKEYSEWISEAKTAATRDKRLAQAVEQIAEGKDRNWKYR
ncbi:YdeI family protein [Chitinophaga sp. GCM10012297]|uniref:YdeI/OmpD-associated family protein n=1 Tax=Chitinophaga chungangae TaxID=2821488 RepID=A0ABS3YAP7_9BACT|nr:YdeI/OmpD-associated family protein [Chitinophaga chungangae]MBO9151555.1 YdeI/OmpD-associated family protein [Chitinophaga chungangae]